MHRQIMPVGMERSTRQFSHHLLLCSETSSTYDRADAGRAAEKRVLPKQAGAWGLSPQLTPRHTTHLRAQRCGAAW